MSIVKVEIFTQKDLSKVMSLVDDLYFDYDRMSTSGQDTLDKIASKLDVLKQGEQSNEQI